MKAEINTNDAPEYPKLMTLIGKGDYVVLFTSPTTGVVLKQGSTEKLIGEHVHSRWDVRSFIPFDGAVTLSN